LENSIALQAPGVFSVQTRPGSVDYASACRGHARWCRVSGTFQWAGTAIFSALEDMREDSGSVGVAGEENKNERRSGQQAQAQSGSSDKDDGQPDEFLSHAKSSYVRPCSKMYLGCPKLCTTRVVIEAEACCTPLLRHQLSHHSQQTSTPKRTCFRSVLPLSLP
jgi:hypothetical protein